MSTRTEESDTVSSDDRKSPVSPASMAVSYPPTHTKLAIVSALGVALLLVGLDSTIVSTAVPTITDQFHSARDIGWYTSAYLLATSASQLYFGKLYSTFATKWVLLFSIVGFEIGALVSGLAPSSVAFIIGRAITGLGRAGAFSGVMSVMKVTLPVHQRPLGGSFVGAIETIAIVSAPVLGGVLTDKASWRWCFLINPPLGAIALVVLAWLVPSNNDKKSPLASEGLSKSLWQKFYKDLDNIGAVLIAVSSICLLLALQWAGIEYPWSNIQVVLPLAFSGATFAAFLLVEWKKGAGAIFPLALLRSRTVSMAAIFSFCLNGAFIVVENYLPIWFQLIKKVSPITSGLMLLPTIISMLVGVAISGVGTSWLGYYVPFMLISSISLSVATGLLKTLQASSGSPSWIGFQVLLGVSIGFGLQQPFVAAQSFASERRGKDVATVTAVILFTQTLGGALAASIAQNFLLRQLTKTIPLVDPSLTPATIKNIGLTDLTRGVSTTTVDALVPVVDRAITDIFTISVIFACLSFPASVFMKWKSVKKAADTSTRSPEVHVGETENKVRLSGSETPAVELFPVDGERQC